MNVINCPICTKTATKELFWAREYILFENTKYCLVKCENCNLVFLNPQPTEEELRRFYPREYFCTHEDTYRSSIFSSLILDKVKEATRFRKSGKLLDIGCGQGWFLQKMQQKGFEVHGLDSSPVACQLASKKVGSYNIFEGNLFSVDLQEKAYDVITLWHVIEHLNTPIEALKRIRGLLKKEGMLIICCPNFNSFLRAIFKENWYPLFVPHHLFQFTLQTLSRILQISGYKVKHQKKHFVDPITNMGSLKISLLRAIGLNRMTGLSPIEVKGDSRLDHRPIWWRIARFCFNIIILVLSFAFSFIGNEEVMLIWATKE